jgi:hypothetical protein
VDSTPVYTAGQGRCHLCNTTRDTRCETSAPLLLVAALQGIVLERHVKQFGNFRDEESRVETRKRGPRCSVFEFRNAVSWTAYSNPILFAGFTTGRLILIHLRRSKTVCRIAVHHRPKIPAQSKRVANDS